MANIAQTVNVLQAVVLTEGEKMVLTPTYHAFEMYQPFQDATFVPNAFADMPDYALGEVSVPMVSATSAKTRDGRLVLGLVNLHPEEPARIAATFDGFAARTASGRVLTADAIDAHNSFDAPETVRPGALGVEVQDGKLLLELPPKSVAVVTVEE
jgi:alpha-N-arabinofuranosidase